MPRATVGFQVSGGSVDIALIDLAGVKHLAIAAHDLAGSISTGGAFDLSVTNAYVDVADAYSWASLPHTWTVPATISTLAPSTTTAGGTVSFTVAGVAAAAGTFTLTTQSSGSDSLLVLSLAGLSMFVGAGASVTGGVASGTVGFQVSGGSVDIALIDLAGVKHLAIAAHDLAGSISTGGAFDLSVTNAYVDVADAYSWASLPHTWTVPATISTLAPSTTTAGGTVSFTVAGVAAAAGTFTLTTQSSGSDSLLVLSLAGLSMFVGAGASVTGGVASGTVGFQVSGGSVDIALIDLAGVKHLAIAAHDLAGSISTGGAFDLSVTNAYVDVADAYSWASLPHTWTVPTTISTLAPSTTTAGGTVSFTVAGVAAAAGTFTLTTQSSGSDSLLVLSLAGLSMFVGAGASVTGGVASGDCWFPGFGWQRRYRPH